MLHNGIFQYKEEVLQFDANGNPTPSTQEWGEEIPCNIQLKSKEERLYVGGEYTNLTGEIIVDKTALEMLSTTNITKVFVTKGDRPLGEYKVLFIEDLPITNKIKIFI